MSCFGRGRAFPSSSPLCIRVSRPPRKCTFGAPWVIACTGWRLWHAIIGSPPGLTVDAEEADRLELSLQLFADVLSDTGFGHWNGLGLAVQAYGKRAMPTIDWLAKVARRSGRRLPLRLVKGAYWDTEIKIAQEQGLPTYPVFTRKSGTDVSYLACARVLLAHRAEFYPQFASHNAHTIAAVIAFAGDSQDYELQRLHGMGEALYEEVVDADGLGKPTRIYAPVGGHEELLAYLVRRLLENGANTSFVNRIADDEAPVADIIADPVGRLAGAEDKTHSQIPLPPDLFQPIRANSLGVPLWERTTRRALLDDMESYIVGAYHAGPIVNGHARFDADARDVLSPHDRRVKVGTVVDASDAHLSEATAAAAEAHRSWDELGGEGRAALLEAAADLFEATRSELSAVIVREAGKTIANALGDVREAIDFLRYYAAEARRLFAEPIAFAGANR